MTGSGPQPGLSPGRLAQLACVLEVTARKPGNVHRFRDFDDAHYLDYLLSASAIAGPLDRAGAGGVGAAVLGAVEATRRVVASNTNLGMILLLAPLAAVPEGVDLEQGIGPVLDALSVHDARLAYRAIRLACPGGLGTSRDQDVADEPTVSLREAMRLAAGRDAVARQYANGFAEVFGVGLPALRSALGAGRGLERAIVESFLTLMAGVPDTLIARKLGPEVALESSRRAAAVLDAGLAPEALDALDAWLRADGHARNPGASADLVSAALFAALRDGTIRLPLAGWAGPSGAEPL
jgi:triphosphoribosyl-dephospho-CoA synthase